LANKLHEKETNNIPQRFALKQWLDAHGALGGSQLFNAHSPLGHDHLRDGTLSLGLPRLAPAIGRRPVFPLGPTS
jgi:hypothetical protein